MVTSYDQDENPISGITFKFFCAYSYEGSCLFQTESGGPAVSSGITDDEGILSIQFSDVASGIRQIQFTTEDDAFAGSVIISVTQVVDCGLSNPRITGVDTSRLTVGIDVPKLAITAIDTYGAPVKSLPVTFESGSLIPKRDVIVRDLGDVMYTGGDGVAVYYVGSLSAAGPQYWSATVPGCSAAEFAPLNWFYGVDCPRSIVTYSSLSLYKDETLTIDGQFWAVAFGTIMGATVSLDTPYGPETIPLLSGIFSKSVTYIPGTSSTWSYTVTFDSALDPCSISGSATVVNWLDRPQPVCSSDLDTPTLIFSTLSPTVSVSVSIIIRVRDSSQAFLAGLPYVLESLTRKDTPQAFISSGLSDVYGNVYVTYTNDGYGTGTDTLQVTLGTYPNDCSISETVTWSLNPT
jgi:hypothetical protein